MDYKYFRNTYIRYLRNFLAKDEMTATTSDKYMALAYAVRNELVDNWINTQRGYIGKRRVYILSMEYMLGKSLYKNMVNLGMEEAFAAAVGSLGISIKELLEKDDEFDLGNGGKARTAACILESIATLGLPSMAYGMRYDYAQFRQGIKNGAQVEFPNDWLHKGHPWENVRSEYACTVKFFGECNRVDANKPLGPYEWTNAEEVYAIPYDVPLVGYKNEVVNTLRLWSARAGEEFLPDYTHHNDYVRACEEKSLSGRITKVLFPDEDVRRAHDLHIKQQYFFVSAVVQDIVRRHKRNGNNIMDLDAKVAIHLNGSSCAFAIPEMMRVLVDQEGIEWAKAWQMTTNIFSYSSSLAQRDHVKTWPVYKINQLLPRIMQVIFDINLEHLELLKSSGASHDMELLRNLSLIEEGEVKRIRFADMAILGSRSVSGVSAVHTELIKNRVFQAHYNRYPEKFNCKTNGVSHRNWLFCANKPLSNLITRTIGDGWVRRPEEFEKLEAYADNNSVLKEFYSVKSMAKAALCETLKENFGVSIDSTMLFDIHGRSVHMSKRQILHILHILHNYLRIKEGGELSCRRAHIFSGKASPSDFLAKQVIHLINVVADLVNNDPAVCEQMRVVFIPNFGVSWAERLVGAADLSEQISTASLEPSGTFNMKYAFNGALTVASRGGSNLELIARMGEENIFAFGKTVEELLNVNGYNPGKLLDEDERLKKIFALLDSHLPNVHDGHAIYPLLSSLRDSDRNFVLLDFADYINKQGQADEIYKDRELWDSKCLRNISRMGWFSTDRLVKDFAEKIWKIM